MSAVGTAVEMSETRFPRSLIPRRSEVLLTLFRHLQKLGKQISETRTLLMVDLASCGDFLGSHHSSLIDAPSQMTPTPIVIHSTALISDS